MDGDPLRSLVEELGGRLSGRGHEDVVLNNGRGEQFRIVPSEFREIEMGGEPRRMAFVDGGDGLLEESPSYIITMNRVYYSLFRGKKRARASQQQRVQFFSYVAADVSGGAGAVKYETRLFAHSEADRGLLPSDGDLTSSGNSASVLRGDRFGSPGRKFAEWRLARHVVERELARGDMLVMDGSLQTSYKNEVRYARDLYEVALDKGVIVCGLAKTSRLVTESGDPLLARVGEIAAGVPYGRWYVRVAEEVSSDDRGFMMVVKLHPGSRFVFRFEILREQFAGMDEGTVNSVLASLAENSEDISMLGYPYGAIDADRFAQVRRDELDMYRGFVRSEMRKRHEWRGLRGHSASIAAHDVLNEVSS